MTLDSATLLYTYISRFSVNPHYQQQLYLRPSFIPIFNFSHKGPTFAFTSESGYTLGFRRRIAHKGSHAETGVFRTGVVSLPSERSTRFGNPAWPGFKTANFAAFGAWSWVLPKASRPRWAALLCLQLGDVAVLSLCAQYFLNVRGRGGITTLGALCVLLKRRTAACQKGSFAAF